MLRQRPRAKYLIHRECSSRVDADVVLDGLQRKLDAARVRLATKGE